MSNFQFCTVSIFNFVQFLILSSFQFFKYQFYSTFNFYRFSFSIFALNEITTLSCSVSIWSIISAYCFLRCSTYCPSSVRCWLCSSVLETISFYIFQTEWVIQTFDTFQPFKTQVTKQKREKIIWKKKLNCCKTKTV